MLTPAQKNISFLACENIVVVPPHDHSNELVQLVASDFLMLPQRLYCLLVSVCVLFELLVIESLLLSHVIELHLCIG